MRMRASVGVRGWMRMRASVGMRANRGRRGVREREVRASVGLRAG